MDRPALLALLRRALEPHADWIRAAFVGGSDATGRTDDRSDVDLQVVLSDPSRTAEAFAVVEAALEASGGIARRVHFGTGPGGAYEQRFYLPAGAPETLMVDLCVMHPERLGPFLDPDRHGDAVVWWDPDGRLTPVRDPDVEGRMAERRAELSQKHPMFAHIPAKELARGDLLAAATSYQRILLSPLITLLRMRHCPRRWDFHARYLDRDLPPDVRERLEALVLPADADALSAAITEARGWIDALLADADG